MRSKAQPSRLLSLFASALIVLPYASIHAAAQSGSAAPSWNPQAAAHYLDTRELEWQHWDHAQKDQGTLCVSCHTQLSYAYVRPTLRATLNEPGLNPPEETMLASIRKRVALWSQLPPFYDDAHSGASKADQSHSTEAVLNAIILLRYDDRHLSDASRAALNNL